jgi:hypothetical protein
MTVRGKFRVESKDPSETGRVAMRAVYSDDPTHENKSFWDATPSGEISMWINNPSAFKYFKLDDDVYVDFTIAPKDLNVSNCSACGGYHHASKVHQVDDKNFIICKNTGKQVFVEETTIFGADGPLEMGMDTEG